MKLLKKSEKEQLDIMGKKKQKRAEPRNQRKKDFQGGCDQWHGTVRMTAEKMVICFSEMEIMNKI